MVLFTVGHGTRSTDELVAVLRSAEVPLLVDVRRYPGSRRLPHLNRDQLEHTVPAAGVGYRWAGESLGGRRSRRPDSRHPAWRNPAFQGYADHTESEEFRSALVDLLADDLPAAVMCSETVWWRCHRRLIADAAELRGVEVVHLLSTTNHQRHPLHPNVRAGEDGWPVYDVGVPTPISGADG